MLVEQSARDLIIGGLLAMDKLVRELDAADHLDDDRQWAAKAEHLKCVVECVCLEGAGPMRRADGRLGSGIPAWLTDPMPSAPASPHGLGALLARDLHGTGGRWSRLFEQLDQEAWLSDLYRLQSELEKAPPAGSARLTETAALAAATGGPPTISGMNPVDDPLAYDHALRGSRSDIALVHPTAPHGVLLGLAISGGDVAQTSGGVRPNTPRIDDRVAAKWPLYEPRFTQGVEAGRRLALELLTHHGVADELLQPWRSVRFQVLGLLPPVSLDEESAGLTVAMHVLATVTGLPLPGRLGVVCTGSADRDSFQPVEDDQLAAKLEAVREDGRQGELLYPGSDGWCRQSVRESASETVSGRLTLAGAAEALWGQRWRRWVDGQHTAALAAAGWRRWEPRTRNIRGAIPIVVRPQAARIFEVFRDSDPTAVVLGGPANSGKTTVAACVGDRLAYDGWQVLGLTSDTHDLDETGQFVKTVSRAVEPHLAEGRRTLVVLDGLWATGRQDLGSAVEILCEQLRTSILVIARFDDSSRAWDTASVLPVPLFVDTAARRKFVEHALAQQPALARLRPALGVLAKAAGPDLWMLTQLLSWASTHSSSPEAAAEQLREAFIADRVAHLSDGERDCVNRLAAASLLATELTESELQLDREKLIALGARPTARDGWILPSSVLCRLLLSESGRYWSPEQTEQHVLALSRPRLHALLQAGDGVGIIRLLRGGASFGERVVTQLIRACQPELVSWARLADPVAIARTLRLADAELSPQVCADLVNRLCRSLSSSMVNAVQLAECLRVINRYRHIAEADGSFADFVSGLRDNGLKLSLQLNASPSARLQALRQLERFHHPELSRLILRNLTSTTQGLRPDRPDDYLTVRRAEDLRQRVVAELADDGHPASSTADLADVPGVGALLERRPTRSDGIALFINALILRIMFGREASDWEDILVNYRPVLTQSLGHSRLAEQVRAFRSLADYHRVLCVRLLNQPELAPYIKGQMEAAQPTEMAFLLRTLAKLHGRFARDLLYESDDTPKADLARLIGAKLIRLGDCKGAGMVLAASAAIDDLYGSRGCGFAHRLAEELTVEFANTAVETDHRPAVLAHFLRGLWEAGADYLDEVTHQIEEASARWLIGSNRPWPARLVLLLGEDDRSGEPFMASLAHRIDEATLLDRMLNTRSAEALSSYHQLGRALFPGLPAQFSQRFDAMALTATAATSRTVSFLRGCSEVRATLSAAGVPNAGQHVLDKADWAGPAELRRVPHPGDLAESLRLLTSLDPVRAAAAVHDLSEEQSTYRSDRNFLEHQVRRSLPNPSTAVELLAAIDRAQPGAGAAVLRKVRSATGAWHAFGVEIAHSQDPREQARVVIQLAKQGLHRGQPGTAWLDTLAQKWLRTVSHVRSPHAVADLIRMFQVWDPKIGTAIADAVNITRLADRIDEGAAADLRATWRLMAAFLVAGRADLAATVSGVLDSRDPADVLQACGLADGAQLAGVLSAVDPAVAARYADPLARLADRAIARRHVVDRQQHWLDIGWAAHALATPSGFAPAGTLAPPVRPDALNPGVSLWGVTWLAQGAWTEEVRVRASDFVVANGPPPLPSAAAAVLVSVARHATPVVNDPADWMHIGEAPFGYLAALHGCSAGDVSVEAVLRLVRDRVRRRVNEPAARADFAAYRLRRLL